MLEMLFGLTGDLRRSQSEEDFQPVIFPLSRYDVIRLLLLLTTVSFLFNYSITAQAMDVMDSEQANGRDFSNLAEQ